MRSIRLSLMIYFLALLGVALGAVSLLAYRTAQQTLTENGRHALTPAEPEAASTALTMLW